jgi:hypothetical protein
MGFVMIVHLGVMEVPYDDGKETTGDVATILEEKYHVMGTFVDMFGKDVIAEAFEASARSAIEDMFSGASPETLNLTFEAEQGVETAFREFIDLEMFDGKIPGVPTAAARRGVNHRFAHPYAKGNQPRPSFRDTGLYQASFKVWRD